MEGVKTYNRILFIIIAIIMSFETIVLLFSPFDIYSVRLFNPITIPLWISILGFGYNAFAKRNNHINLLTVLFSISFIFYLIISW